MKIIIYGTTWCPSCVSAKRFFDEMKLSYDEINIEKETTFGETFTDNKSSFQTENLLRKIFSYYKTPILLNEIFK